MFRVIGGAVVYGLALYGVVKILERPKLPVANQPNANHGDKDGSEAASAGEAGVDGNPEETAPGSPVGFL